VSRRKHFFGMDSARWKASAKILLAALIVAPCAPLHSSSSEDEDEAEALAQPGSLGWPCNLDADCSVGFICADAHYFVEQGAAPFFSWQPSICVAQDSGAEIVEAPLQIEEIVVTAKRINPPAFRLSFWSPPQPLAVPWPLPLPLLPVLSPPEEPEEDQDAYKFGRCVRVLAVPYLPTESDIPLPDWDSLEAFRQLIDETVEEILEIVQGQVNKFYVTHHDVVWGMDAAGEPADFGYEGAGFHPVSAIAAFTPEVRWDYNWGNIPPISVSVSMPTVPGTIKALSPVPSSCSPQTVEEADYLAAAAMIEADEAAPPAYHLLNKNCQRWADKILAEAGVSQF